MDLLEQLQKLAENVWPSAIPILAGIGVIWKKWTAVIQAVTSGWESIKSLFTAPTKILQAQNIAAEERAVNQESILKRLDEQDKRISENLSTVIKRLDGQDEKLLVMSKELTANGGSSVKDHIKETYNLAVMTQAVTKSLFYNNPTPSFECEPLEGLCSRCNTALESQWGLNENEMRGKGWLSAVIGDAKEKNQIWENYQESLKLEVPYSAEYHIYNRRTKEKVTVQIEIHPLKDNKGKILLYQGTSVTVSPSV